MFLGVDSVIFDHRHVHGGLMIIHRKTGRCFYCFDTVRWRLSEVFKDGLIALLREDEADFVARAAWDHARDIATA